MSTSPPADTTFSGQIPTVDLNDSDPDNLVRSIAAAGKEWGIFQVVNHGISDDLIEKLKVVGREFFELSTEEKESYALTQDAKNSDGYGSSREKNYYGKKSWHDFFCHMIWPPSSVNYNYWPPNPPSYREVNEEYAKNIVEVSNKLFKCLSLGLGLEEHVLKEASGGEAIEYRMKMNYYPPCPLPDLTIGVTPHTDFPNLTIMVCNEISGLQILKDDSWIDVKYIPNALIVHIGDQIEILSNGQYKSVLHRTIVDKKNTRMSWPIFVRPPAELELGPLSEFVDQVNPPKYEFMKFKDYISRKFNKITV